MIYNLAEEFYAKELRRTRAYTESGNFESGKKLITKSIESNGLSIVQGPPGTGKTTLYEAVIKEMINRLGRNEHLVYIAPSNRLVHDMFKKVLSLYSTDEAKRFLEEVRIYGSQFDYTHFENLRRPVDDKVKIILTTDYQRVFNYSTLSQISSHGFHMLVDEASKSPLHLVFIPIAEEILKGGREVVASFNIVGDPMQAISLLNMYRVHRLNYLIMDRILLELIESADQETYNKISNGDIDLMDAVYELGNKLDHYELLDVTKRLPCPTNEIIGNSFYNGKLKCEKDGGAILKEINSIYKKELIDRFKQDVQLKNYATDIEEMITTNRIGLYCYVSDRSYSDPERDLYDPLRAKLATYYAFVLAAVTGTHTTVIVPYVDMQLQVEFLLKRIGSMYNMPVDSNEFEYGHIKENRLPIVVATAHSMIGSEDDNVVIVLGKEYRGEEELTMYFNEPEVLNVQFSRHRGMLIIIGDLGRLRTNAIEAERSSDSEAEKRKFKRIRILTEEVARLAGGEFTGEGKSKFQPVRGGPDILLYKRCKDAL